MITAGYVSGLPGVTSNQHVHGPTCSGGGSGNGLTITGGRAGSGAAGGPVSMQPGRPDAKPVDTVFTCGYDGGAFVFRVAGGLELLRFNNDGVFYRGQRMKLVRRGFWPFRRYWTIEVDHSEIADVLEALAGDAVG